MRSPGSGSRRLAPQPLVDAADVVLRDVPVARVLVGERPHVARALHVVLPAERVHADALAADVAGDHGQVGHAHHHRGALGVLGDAEAVVDRGVAARGVEPGGGAQLGRGRCRSTSAIASGRVGRVGDEGEVVVGVLAPLAHELLVVEPLGDDHVRHRVDEGDVGARQDREVVGRLDVRAAHQVDAARVGHDQPGAGAQPLASSARRRRGVRRWGWRRSAASRRPGRPSGSPGCRRTCRRSASGRSPWGSGRRARRCRCCCCRTPPGPSSGRRRPPRWCTGSTRCRRSRRRRGLPGGSGSRPPTLAIASSHETLRHSSSIVSRTIGESWRSLWAAYP